MPRHDSSRKLLDTINLDICDDPGEADTTPPKKLNTGFLFLQHARQKSLVAVIDRKERRKEARQAARHLREEFPPTITLKKENINWIGVEAWRDRSSIHENMSIFHLIKSWLLNRHDRENYFQMISLYLSCRSFNRLRPSLFNSNAKLNMCTKRQNLNLQLSGWLSHTLVQRVGSKD